MIRISDGDTIVVLDENNRQHRVRLTGIDAPEKCQPFYNVSRQHLAHLVFQKKVAISYGKFDRNGRPLGKVFIDGRDINLEQVNAGFAWHFKRYQKEQPAEDRVLYAAAEDAARAPRRGLWLDPDPIAPWEWRKTPKRGSCKLLE